jgi:hypothetical protein
MEERINQPQETKITRQVDGAITQVSGTMNMQRQQNNFHTINFEKKCLVNINLEELKQKYLSGLSLRQLALEYNTSKITLKKKLLKLGVLIRKDQTTRSQNAGVSTKVDENLFITLHQSGHTTKELMQTFHIASEIIIKRIYKRLNLRSNHSDITSKLLNMFQATRKWDTYENLYELYVNQEKSIAELASILHADEGTIHSTLQKFGIRVRPQQEATKIAANKPEMQVIRSEKMW